MADSGSGGCCDAADSCSETGTGCKRVSTGRPSDPSDCSSVRSSAVSASWLRIGWVWRRKSLGRKTWRKGTGRSGRIGRRASVPDTTELGPGWLWKREKTGNREEMVEEEDDEDDDDDDDGGDEPRSEEVSEERTDRGEDMQPPKDTILVQSFSGKVFKKKQARSIGVQWSALALLPTARFLAISELIYRVSHGLVMRPTAREAAVHQHFEGSETAEIPRFLKTTSHIYTLCAQEKELKR